jgi:O-antigen/teichoic acid export membrane protein
MKDRIARSVFWVFWSRGGMQALSFASTIVIARLLDPGDYGVMALAGIFTGILGTISQMGLGGAIVQFHDMDERELSNCFWITIAVTCLGYLGLFMAAPAIAAWFDTPILSPVLQVAGISLPLSALSLVPGSLLRRRLEFDKLAYVEILAGIGAIVTMLLLASLGAGVWTLVAGTLISPLLYNVVVFWFLPWMPTLPSLGGRLTEVLRYSVATLGARVGWDVYEQTDVVVLGKVGGELSLGFYSMAMQFAMLPVTKISVPVNGLAFPVMSVLQRDTGAMRASFLRGLRMVACVTVPLCVGMLLVADDLISVVLTEKWAATVPLLQVLSLAALVRSLTALLPPVLFARYRASYVCWWMTALVLMMPFAFWAGAAALGAIGVALAWVIVYPWLTFWMAQETIKEIDLDWKTIWDHLKLLLVPLLAMVVAVVAVQGMLAGNTSHDRLLRLIMSVGGGGLSYGLTIYWRGGRMLEEIMEVAGWLLWPRRAAPDAKMAVHSAR